MKSLKHSCSKSVPFSNVVLIPDRLFVLNSLVRSNQSAIKRQKICGSSSLKYCRIKNKIPRAFFTADWQLSVGLKDLFTYQSRSLQEWTLGNDMDLPFESCISSRDDILCPTRVWLLLKTFNGRWFRCYF